MEAADQLKNELHALVRLDPLGYFRVLKTFDYPNVDRGRIPEFIQAVRAFLFRNGFIFRNEATMALCDLLQEASSGTSLDFLVDNDPDVLVNSFDNVFLYRMATFYNAMHVFDDEPQIAMRWKHRRLVYGDQGIDYRFSNSKAEPAIQVADVLCGILGRHFSWMEKLSIVSARPTHLNLLPSGDLWMADR